jgi:hypothetical protein
MPRTSSLQKAQEALADLGLVVTLDRTRLWVLNPDTVVAVSKVKRSTLYEHDTDRTVGMVLVFDADGKFAGANYSTMHWDDGRWSEGKGYEVRTDTGTWSPDERTLKAALSFLQGFSPVGSAQAAAEAQEAAQAAEKAEQERAANLAVLNQTVQDNPDTRRWAADVAQTVVYERRRLISELRDLAKRAEETAASIEKGKRPGSHWFHAGTVITIMEHLAKLEALESTVEGPLGDSIKAVAERYGY